MESIENLAFKNHYVKAITSLDKYGLYWFTDTRKIAYMLDTLVLKAGYRVLLCEIAPRYEFVIYESDKFGYHDLLKIAMRRREEFERGIEEYLVSNV